jgi:hypothetical protein
MGAGGECTQRQIQRLVRISSGNPGRGPLSPAFEPQELEADRGLQGLPEQTPGQMGNSYEYLG